MKRSFTISMLVFILYMFASCRTEYIPVESVRYDSIFLAKLEKDSIFIRDSIYIKEKGDTVFKDRVKYVYRYVGQTDTIFIEKTDTIRVPVPVERKLTWWERQKQDFRGFFYTAFFIYVIYRLMKWIIRKNKKRISSVWK